MSDHTPDLADVLEEAIAGRLAGVRVALPGRIESYDTGTRRATGQILVMDGDVDEQGERITTTIKPLTDVPVMRIGSGVERFKFPVRSGDLCTLLFASSSIASFKSRGDLVDPEDDRHHHEADAIAITGLFTGGTDVPGATIIEIDEQEILNLGASPAVSSAVLGEQLVSALSTLVGSIATAVGTSGTPAGATAAAGAITAALAVFTGAVASFLSQKVKLV